MNKRPKLLFIITQGHWGGAQRYIFDLAVGLRADYEISVAIGDADAHDKLLAKLADCNIPQRRLTRLHRKILPLSDILAIKEIRRLITNERPDIIHLNSSKAGVIGSAAARLVPRHIRPKVVYTAHGWVFDEPLSAPVRFLYFFLETITAMWKDAIIVLGQKDSDTAVRRLRADDNRVVKIPIGIAPVVPLGGRAVCRSTIRVATKPQLNEADNTFWIGAIANHYRTKGLDVLVSAAKTVCAAKPDTIFIIIGDGPERPALTGQIQKNGLVGRVILLGPVEDAAKLLPAFDLFVLPSRKEGLPYTLLETMSAGAPVIATDVGAIPEIIADKKTGLLTPPEDSAGLAATILFALSHPAEMKSMASAAKQTTERYSLVPMITKMSHLYQTLLAEFH